MKKSLLMISMMLVLAITLGGCATTGDLEKVQAQEMQNRAKADQAAQDAQAAKVAADAAALKADAASTRADNAVKMADERAKLADERAQVADEKARLADEKAKLADEKAQKSRRHVSEINEEVSQFYGELLTLPLALRKGYGRVLIPCRILMLPRLKSAWTIQAFNLSQDIRQYRLSLPVPTTRLPVSCSL